MIDWNRFYFKPPSEQIKKIYETNWVCRIYVSVQFYKYQQWIAAYVHKKLVL